MAKEIWNVEHYSFLAIFLFALGLGFLIIKPFLNDLLIAAVFAVFFHPVYEWILKNSGGGEGSSAFLTVIIILVVVLFPLIAVGYQIFMDAGSLYASIVSGGNQSALNSVSELLEKYSLNLFRVNPESLKEYAQDGFGWIVGNIGFIFSSFSRLLINLVITLISMYYFLKDGQRFRNRLAELSPLSEDLTHRIASRIQAALKAVIKGSLIIALLQGFLTATGFWIFGVDGAALWGAITVMASLIPVVGSGLVFAPAVIYFLLSGQMFTAVGLLLWGAILVGFSDNLIRPLLIRRGIQIHSFFIFLSVLGGISLFGIFGFIWGPLLLAMLFVLLDYYPAIILGKNVSQSA